MYYLVDHCKWQNQSLSLFYCSISELGEVEDEIFKKRRETEVRTINTLRCLTCLKTIYIGESKGFP